MPIADGDTVQLESKWASRWCSVSVDGTLLCISSQPSNATRNLFTIGMHRTDIRALRVG